MHLYLEQGDYVLSDDGCLKTIPHCQLIINQIMTQLQVKKGSFIYDKTLGSAIYKLKNYNSSDLQVNAYRSAFDAICMFPNVKLADVICTYLEKLDCIKLEVGVIINEKNYNVEVQI